MSEEERKEPEYSFVLVFPKEERIRSLLKTGDLEKLAKVANTCYFHCSESVVLEIERNNSVVRRFHKHWRVESAGQLEPGESVIMDSIIFQR